MGIGNLCRLNHLFHRGILDAESDIVEERIVEEDSLLIDVADERAEVVDAELANVCSVDGDTTARDIVVARQQVYERRLARTRLPDDGLAP